MKEITKIILKELEEKNNASTIKRYEKNNEVKPYFGVLMGEIGKIGKKYSKEKGVFMELWRTGNLDAQLTAIAMKNHKELSEKNLRECISKDLSTQVIDKFTDQVLCAYGDNAVIDSIEKDLEKEKEPALRRYYWGLMINKVKGKKLDEKEVSNILNVIERDLASSEETEKWAMNRCFVEIALNYPDNMQRVLDSSEKIGAYRDMKVSKGCTSAFAPSWIAAVTKSKK